MEEKIKLIWDFKGPSAAKIAAHHEQHLKEYSSLESISPQITGHTHLNTMHSIAFIVVVRSMMLTVRDALKPHRAEVYSN